MNSNRARRRAGVSRPSFTILLLLLTLGATAVLAYQALDASRSQRATAESVLNDYASLAANEAARRIEQTLGFYGIYYAFTPLNRGGDELPDPETARYGRADETRLARTYFRYSIKDASVAARGEDPVGFFAPDLLQRLEDRALNFQPDWRWAAVFTEGEPFDIVAFRPLPPEGALERIEGFVAHPEAVRQRLLQAVEQPVMPAPLDENVDSSQLHIAVDIPGPRRLFQSSEGFASDTPLADGIYSRAELGGQLGGMAVYATLDPSSAESLVIGGLPGTRVPLLLGLMLLTAGLIAAALLQMSRERDFARRQRDFIAAVSHELRTPLAQIRMFSDTLLLGRVRSPDEEERSLRIITQETQRLANLVENVIQFSRSERQKTKLNLRQVELLPLLQEVQERFQPLADSTGSKVSLRAEGQCTLQADPDALRRILLNLLDNAVKYGPAGQTITLGMGVLPDTVRIWVEDEGEGLDEEECEIVFRRFERLPRHRNAAVAGTGIGLAVVKELVQAQESQVWCERGRGGGARFVVEFPL